MEQDKDIQKKKKRKKLVFLGLGITAAGVLGFFGWDQYKKWKEKKNTERETEDEIPQIKNPSTLFLPIAPPKPTANDEFPLKKGSKGTRVKQLQEALISKYGKTILPKYGADGDFGTETINALKTKGLSDNVDENTFNVLVKARVFDAKTLSDAIYKAAVAKNFSQVSSSLKQMKTTDDYSAVSENFKLQRLNGVHQTLVNGLLSSFSGDQKQQVQMEFLRMGLKFDGSKWSLSGIPIKQIVTTAPTLVWKDKNSAVKVPANIILGYELAKRNGHILFQSIQGGKFIVKTETIKYL